MMMMMIRRRRRRKKESCTTRLDYQHQPRLGSFGVLPPVISDDALYWIVGDTSMSSYATDDVNWPDSCNEAILSFDIKKEGFDFLPHPGPCCNSRKDALYVHPWMRLVENHTGLLSLCQCSGRLYTIWAFKEESEQQIINYS